MIVSTFFAARVCVCVCVIGSVLEMFLSMVQSDDGDTQQVVLT